MHIASANRCVLVFQCYLDDSGTSPNEPIVTMAGFVASHDQWEKLEAHYEKVFEDFGVDVLHAKDFRDGKKCFSGWSNQRKQKFVNSIFDQSKGRIGLGISISSIKQDYRNRQNETQKNKHMSAYGVCFSSIMMRVLAGPEISKYAKQSGVAFFIESGNKNNDEVFKFYQKMKEKTKLREYLREIGFLGKNDCRAIQVADFYAFYTRRNAVKHDKFSGKLAMLNDPYHDRICQVIPTFEHVITDPYLDPNGIGRIEDFPGL